MPSRTRQRFSRTDVVGLSGPVFVRRKDGTRAQARFASGPLRKYIYERDGGQCQYCGTEVEMETCQIDHLHPWHHGGKTAPRNFVLACRRCNQLKSAQVIPRGLQPTPIPGARWKRLPWPRRPVEYSTYDPDEEPG